MWLKGFQDKLTKWLELEGGIKATIGKSEVFRMNNQGEVISISFDSEESTHSLSVSTEDLFSLLDLEKDMTYFYLLDEVISAIEDVETSDRMVHYFRKNLLSKLVTDFYPLKTSMELEEKTYLKTESLKTADGMIYEQLVLC